MPRTTEKAPDAVALLKSDHRTVEKLFEWFENSKSKSTKGRSLTGLYGAHGSRDHRRGNLLSGSQGVCGGRSPQRGLCRARWGEVLIAEILSGSPDEEFYDAKVKVLSEMIKHHVKEEEQKDGLFAQAKKGDVDMRVIGEQLAGRKAELTTEFKRNGIPQPETRAMKGAEASAGTPRGCASCRGRASITLCRPHAVGGN